MAARRFLLATLSLGLVAAIGPRMIFADDTTSDGASADVENARHSFIGSINASAVFVRSGPRDDAYQTMKLDKGTEVTVIGIKFDWLKILPPPGSFAYVPKVYVERHGDGSVGRATREIIAKVGSDLNPLKIAPMAKVDEGDDVQIIGEADEYFKIQPPAGSALWVNKQFVDPVRMVPDATPDNKNTMPIADSGSNTPAAPATPDASGGPTTLPSGAEAAAPATQPADEAAKAADQFDSLESDYAAATDKSITEQPVAELLSGYQALLKMDALPDSMRQIAEVRVATLKMRDEAKQEYLAFKETQDKTNERRKALAAEQEEIEARVKENSVTLYAAVGTLRTSSIQHAGATLYRITDPDTGRTVAYIRTSDSGPMALLGQFVGVKGTITNDDALNLKMIDNPTVVEAVDQTKVNSSVAAQILPPSLLPHTAQASTSGE
jgi:SH3-like domain-containing protein